MAVIIKMAIRHWLLRKRQKPRGRRRRNGAVSNRAGAIQDCIDCGKCTEKGCIFTGDPVNAFIAKAKEADGFIFGTPVYYAHPTGRVLSFLDRVFHAASGIFRLKPGASIAVARRAGTTASIDAMNKYFTIAEMPVVSSTYWNVGHGLVAGDILKDAEGLQTMRNLGKNMAYLLKCLEAGKKAGIELPGTKREVWTTLFAKAVLR